MIPVIWLACDCTCWPITPMFGTGRCGRCGKPATEPCHNITGMAYDL